MHTTTTDSVDSTNHSVDLTNHSVDLTNHSVDLTNHPDADGVVVVDDSSTTEVKDGKPSNAKKPYAMENLYSSSIAYSVFTVTDGAVRMIVMMYAYNLGFDAVEIALMFSLYELAGVVTNLFGGVAGATYGVKCTLLTSLVLQILGLSLLCLVEPIFGSEIDEENRLGVTAYIVFCQAFSGVAKDFMKLSGKSVPKLVTGEGAEDRLFKLVAWLTGAKNSMKGVGYFLGSALVAAMGFWEALVVMIGLLVLLFYPSIKWMDVDIGKSEKKVKVDSSIFKKGWNVNILSLARFFLFGSRDVWFEIAAPIFLRSIGWDSYAVGAFMAGYIIIYGNLQAATTTFYKEKKKEGQGASSGRLCCTLGVPTRTAVPKWAAATGVEVFVVGLAIYFPYRNDNILALTVILILGLVIFAGLFAVNSAVHSYLIVSYSNKDKVSMDLGFYYMGNAMGRLVGTLASGFIYRDTQEEFGLSVCMWVASGFLLFATLCSFYLRDPELTQKTDARVAQTASETAVGRGQSITVV